MGISKWCVVVCIFLFACTDKYQSLDDLNTAPKISLSANSLSVRAGDTITTAGRITLKCSDRENNAIHYEMVDTSNGVLEVMYDNHIAPDNIIPIITDSTRVIVIARQEGLYKVKFLVVDRFGKNDSAELMVQSVPNQAPVAQLSVSLVTGREYKLNAGNSADPDGIVKTYHYTIDGSNINSASAITNHIFYSAGTKTITLFVEDDAGALSDVITKTITVP